MARKKAWLWVSILVYLGTCALEPAYPSQIKKIESLIVDLSNESSKLIPLSVPVNPLQTFIIQSAEQEFKNVGGMMSTTGEYDEDGINLIAGSLYDSGNVRIRPGQSGSSTAFTARLGIHVVEYGEGLKVFSGRSSMGPHTYIKDIILPETIDTTKSFPLITIEGNILHDEDKESYLVKATLVDANTLRLERLDVPGTKAPALITSLHVVWQVIEIQNDVVVKSGTASIPYDTWSIDVDLGAHPIQDIKKAFLIFNFTGGAGINGVNELLMTRGTIADPKTLIFGRRAAGDSKDQSIDIAWYVVEFTDSASNVQKGSTTLEAGSSLQEVSLGHGVDPQRAFPIISVSGAGTSQSALSDFFVRPQMKATTSLAHTLTLNRHTHAAAVDVDWFVVELAPLTVEVPNEGQVWRIGEVQKIKWSWAQSLQKRGSGPQKHHALSILLSTNGGESFPLVIADRIDATLGSYVWVIPPLVRETNIISDQLKVRVIDQDFADHNYDDSNNAFEIKGKIELVAPLGGETWFVGDTNRDIMWTKAGDFSRSTFSIQLSEDGGSTYGVVLAEGLTQKEVCDGDKCSWKWLPAVADQIGADQRIKVSLASDPENVFDVSGSDFSIKGKLQIVSPNGDEAWGTESTQLIQWNKWGRFDKVSLYYSINSGAAFDYIIAQNISAGDRSGSYSWRIPEEAASNFARVKVASEQPKELSVQDISDGDFGVVLSQLEIIYPNARDEVWYVGDSKPITWQLKGPIEKVHCWYSHDGKKWVRITPPEAVAADRDGGEGLFMWSPIPDVTSDSIFIRVARNEGDASPGAPFDDSNNPLTVKGKLKLITPNGGESYEVASKQDIRWDTKGSMGNVKITFAHNGIDFDTVITPSSGVPASRKNFVWESVPDTVTNRARLRIELITDPSGVFDDSDEYFSIKGSLGLTSPNGGQIFYVNENAKVTWEAKGTIGNVHLRYSTDGGATFPDSQIIASVVGQDASGYNWTIPDVVGDHLRVKVTAIGDEAISDMSDRDFQIKGKLKLLSPNGNEIYGIGSAQEIKWQRQGRNLGNVKLEYSANNGKDGYPHLIVKEVPSKELSYSWQIPEAAGDKLKVRIALLDDSAVSDTSDDTFTIKERIALLAPIGGEVWRVGTQENIMWNTYGEIGKVNVYYSTNGGDTYPHEIARGITNVGGYLWTIPDIVESDVRVSVESFAAATVYTTSPADFSIKGRVIVESPNGGEVLSVGAKTQIQWRSQGEVGNIQIRYSTDGGATYPQEQVIVGGKGIPVDKGSFWWVVPDQIGSDLKIKIVSISDPGIADESDGTFSAKGKLELTSPDGGESFTVAEAGQITWQRYGSIGEIQIRYSIDGGKTYPHLITSSTPSQEQQFRWTSVPETLSNQCRVKITSLDDPLVSDTSSSNFRIKPSLQLTSPVGEEIWIVGSSQDITWTKVGPIQEVALEYSVDGGNTYDRFIAAVPASKLHYVWEVGDAIGDNVKVRIRDAQDVTVYDVCDQDLSIKGALTVGSPKGGEVLVVDSDYEIQWKYVGSLTDVKIEYSTDGGKTYPHEIAPAVAAAALSYAWKIPDTISDTCKVRISNVSDESVYDESQAYFKIKGDLVLTAPNGGQAWQIDSQQDITWRRVGDVGNMKLEYSIDGGSRYPNVIVAGYPSKNQQYQWAVPDHPSTQCKVRITSLDDPAIWDESDYNFSIVGALDITSPDGGEVWTVASNQEITWSMVGNISTVRLEYSTDGGSTYPHLIAEGVYGEALRYAWRVPDTIGNRAKIRITDESNSTIQAQSEENFSIKGSVVVSAPNGAEVWFVGDSERIKWTKSGSV
ncbi:MAG: hypothetical protein JSW40_08260, partial [Candidatus Omnitrophota bacterium]